MDGWSRKLTAKWLPPIRNPFCPARFDMEFGGQLAETDFPRDKIWLVGLLLRGFLATLSHLTVARQFNYRRYSRCQVVPTYLTSLSAAAPMCKCRSLRIDGTSALLLFSQMATQHRRQQRWDRSTGKCFSRPNLPTVSAQVRNAKQSHRLEKKCTDK